MEHTRFLLLTRSTSVEGCCLRIEREARKIAECTSYTPCVLLSFSSSFPTHVLPVLSVRKRLCILCVPPKFHNLPSRGNIIPFGEISLRNILLKTDNFRFLCQKTRQISLRILAIKMRSHFYRRKWPAKVAMTTLCNLWAGQRDRERGGRQEPAAGCRSSPFVYVLWSGCFLHHVSPSAPPLCLDWQTPNSCYWSPYLCETGQHDKTLSCSVYLLCCKCVCAIISPVESNHT